MSQTLEEFFKENNKIALGFSGGTDSAFLLWNAVHYGADVGIYFAKSAFQPLFELEDARRLCRELGVQLRVLELDVLQDADVVKNDEKRCYYCKNQIFGALKRQALADGYHVIIDGTNASDDVNDRPGYQALQEMEVRSPLRECKVTKADVRELSKEIGLFTAEKPSYACLATRVWEHPLTTESLARAEKAEAMVAAKGFSDFRVRCQYEKAILQMNEDQYDKAVELLPELQEALGQLFEKVVLDEAPRKLLM
ncbi:MAG: ATP-dependent sacrificial sulfur transferase LarE [Lachnospiraceae bacterium]|nr:ATP-dependent sacrificial sulfur transferase LarE [Lachnospiraceae bacterium]